MSIAVQENAHTSRPHAPQRCLRTVAQFCEEHPAFTPGGMRWLLFNREQNGLSHAVIKLGKRVLIDVPRFFQWLDTHNEDAG